MLLRLWSLKGVGINITCHQNPPQAFANVFVQVGKKEAHAVGGASRRTRLAGDFLRHQAGVLVADAHGPTSSGRVDLPG
jgi:hypothetical protein